MEKNYWVLQEKTFCVELQSSRPSSGYGWMISSLPKELVFVGLEERPLGPGNANIITKFFFGAVSAENTNTKIEFVLAAPWKLLAVADTYTAYVQIVPSNSGNFMSYQDGAALQTPFAKNENEHRVLYKYGYPCTVEYPSEMRAYGFPGVNQNANVKYGYGCAESQSDVKYGYPCVEPQPDVKYGYPCAESQPYMKYGYPGCC